MVTLVPGTYQWAGEFTAETWDWALDDMIYAMDYMARLCQEGCEIDDEYDLDRVELGFRLFGKHFRSLWW